MGEEVRMTEYEVNGNNDEETNGDDERVLDWEMGLPNGDELTPLSQSLIPLELATAFSISPIQYKTSLEVNRASQTTLSSLRGSQSHALSSNNNTNMKSFNEARDPMVLETDETDQNGSGSESRRSRKPESPEEADSALRMENSTDDPSARTLKRPRLVWTPQLHKRFVDVVGHLGIKNAVPKTIMQLMNVEGLTRENVASHLQKYRLYLKRMQGLPNDEPSSSDQLFSSTPVPPHLHYESGANSNNKSSNNNGNSHVAGAYGAPAMMSVPMYGMMNNGFHPGHGFEPSMFNMNMNINMGINNMLQQRDWSVNKHGHGSVISYQHHVAPRSENEGAH